MADVSSTVLLSSVNWSPDTGIIKIIVKADVSIISPMKESYYIQ